MKWVHSSRRAFDARHPEVHNMRWQNIIVDVIGFVDAIHAFRTAAYRIPPSSNLGHIEAVLCCLSYATDLQIRKERRR